LKYANFDIIFIDISEYRYYDIYINQKEGDVMTDDELELLVKFVKIVSKKKERSEKNNET
jgi:hypothetical protein